MSVIFLEGGSGTDSARGIRVGVVALLMSRSSACFHRRWHKTLLVITIEAKERLVRVLLPFPFTWMLPG